MDVALEIYFLRTIVFDILVKLYFSKIFIN